MMIKQRSASLGLCLSTSVFLGLLVLLVEPQSVQAQWATSGNNINNTNTGNVGVGTTAPSTKLEVVGNINAKLAIDAPATTTVRHIFNGASAWLAQDATNGELDFGYNLYYNNGFKYRVTGAAANIRMYLGAFQFQTAGTGSANAAINWTDRMVISANGNVGIGTTNPGAKLQVASSSDGDLIKLTTASAGNLAGALSLWSDGSTLNHAFGSNYYINSSGSSQRYDGSRPAWTWLLNASSTSASDSAQLYHLNSSGSGTIFMHLNTNGDVGIGTTTPGAKLEVVGNVNVTGTGNITAAGTIEGGNIKAKYQDVAEWVESSQELSAGTLVVLDHTKSNQVIASSQAYDTRVAGVISERPGIALGEGGDNKVLVATSGRVRLRVDTSNGPIQIGDLLVTSDIPGVAMKSEAVEFAGRKMHMPGTIIGKALEPLAKGSGEILVLLSLQ